MPDAVDRPDEGEAVPEEGDAEPVPPPAHATDAPELELPEGASSGDDGRKLKREETDKGFGELTEPQRYEEGHAPLGDGPDELWADLVRRFARCKPGKHRPAQRACQTSMIVSQVRPAEFDGPVRRI